MYDPSIGRFTSVDPTGFAAGDDNLYRLEGNNPTNATDPSGLAAINNEDRFREAAKRNGVPDEMIDWIVDSAKGTNIPPPWARGVAATHNYCEKWVDTFENNLQKVLLENGYKDGVSQACKGSIKFPPQKTVFNVPGGGTGNPDLLCRSQDHTAMKITFKDGTVFYIDCKTLSSSDVNNLTGGASHFCPADKVPKDWKTYPLPEPPSLLPPGPISPKDAREFDRKFPGSEYGPGPKW